MLDEREATRYDFRTVERKWQAAWEHAGLYRARDDDPREKCYVLEMLPYPSGDLHVGHAKNYTLGDAVARMWRMHGYNVLHPMAFDAFGLPAENAAIERGADPAAWTRGNIANMQRQIRLMGTGYDWSREFATCDVSYYRWNQWLFLHLYRRGLAYKREAPVNWCPFDQTVLANEQVENGRCWRCGHLVERRLLSQWFLRITAYADRLLEGLERLPAWPERIKTMQRNWIGKSEGVTVSFEVEGSSERISVFTTRIDTLFGVTYLAVAPEHAIVSGLIAAHADYADRVERFAADVRNRSELERTSLMEKSGVFTGAYARNPLSNERIPVWVTNYVLAEYGSGAVMGVPAHDERDFEFVRSVGLPVARVIEAPGTSTREVMQEAYLGEGRLLASGDFSGMPSERAREAIADRLVALGIGQRTTQYRIRDWLVSRQRYWGTPIPIVYCPHHGEVALPESSLPVELPANVPITGEGSPLARDLSFMQTTCPHGDGPARRESDTLDTFFESSWYYVRYLDPHNSRRPFGPDRAAKWLNVDQYIGGAEHAVLHLLYARFFYKVFYDEGWVRGVDEPFERLFNQGMVLYGGEKMSKSRGNVVGIDETVERYGVDAMRLFLLKATPPEDAMEWTEEGIAGRVRFLDRMWRACEPVLPLAREVALDALPEMRGEVQREIVRSIHLALKSGAEETASRRFHYNTTLARLDELTNALTKFRASGGRDNDPVVLYAVGMVPLLLAPFAPHIAEELWARLGHETSVHVERWPAANPLALSVDRIVLVVQVNGKLRARIEANPGLAESEAVALALRAPAVSKHLGG
ncbi:MAG: leucine--tRNA ligase, partial [Candidatus Eremiobacteraeota bacterium]|nr:leucine--tRNA ligase [Candidatus Eremiobacteraeota bacterium]